MTYRALSSVFLIQWSSLIAGASLVPGNGCGRHGSDEEQTQRGCVHSLNQAHGFFSLVVMMRVGSLFSLSLKGGTAHGCRSVLVDFIRLIQHLGRDLTGLSSPLR